MPEKILFNKQSQCCIVKVLEPILTIIVLILPGSIFILYVMELYMKFSQ